MNPKLREIRTQPIVSGGRQGILLSDPLSISPGALFIPRPLALILALLDGTRDIGTVRAGFELRTGTPLNISILERLISELDEALFLDNERFAQAYALATEDFRSAVSRLPILVGRCCPADAGELGAFLQTYLDQMDDADMGSLSNVKGLVSPHIDFPRGGPIYARVWAKAKAAVNEAELVAILGTDHNGGDGTITLTRQNYETPWGMIPTAQDVVDEVAAQAGDEVFRYELHHSVEHSVEAAIIWLHYLLDGRQCQVLPVLCGSFRQFIDRGESPSQSAHISATVETLKRVAARRQTLVVAAGDLAHVGPAFGDPYSVDFAGRAKLASQDKRLMEIMSRGQAQDFYEEIRREDDRRHICGMPPIYIAQSVLSGVDGSSVGYAQCPASEDGSSVVSICGMIYHA
jgi:AmmeMemoRadiSam system protein B